ncbi:MAG: hypothetical protein KDB00_22025 [Planctomycetales bacterium]|nr:hypothetical protein [Planctomycetales bacterium]
MPDTTHTIANLSPATLATRSDNTNLWKAQRWGARVRAKGEERWIDLNKPFALVGSDPRCDVQIGDSKLPSVVYLVVACGDRIEVWPTCPLAFPIWGRVNKNHILLVGKCRIQFYFKEDQESDFSFVAELDDDSADISQDNFEQDTSAASKNAGSHANVAVSSEAMPTAKLILDWGRGPRYKSLNRNVSIIGEDHPSLIRLHHADLYRCDHGVVCFGDDVWLIELHPDRAAANDPLIRQIRPGDPSALVGGIHLWVEGAEPVALESLTRSPEPVGRKPIEGPLEEVREPLEESVANAVQSTMSQDDATATGPENAVGPAKAIVQESYSATTPVSPTTASPEVTERVNSVPDVPQRAMVTAGTGVIEPESDSDIRRRVSTVERTSHDEAESITMELTDRLLETNARKSFRRRALKISGISALAIIAIGVVIGILAYGVMPIIRSIYGD